MVCFSSPLNFFFSFHSNCWLAQIFLSFSIIFVNSIDRCYRVKLFLEQFGIQSCVLNSELPYNSRYTIYWKNKTKQKQKLFLFLFLRYHIVQEFNKGVYDYIIATDEHEKNEEDEEGPHLEIEEQAARSLHVLHFFHETTKFLNSKNTFSKKAKQKEKGKAKAKEEEPKKKNKGSDKKDQEFGVTRGVDFKEVEAVINFDFPLTPQSYTHRVGRTARGGARGTALSFVCHMEVGLLQRVEEEQSGLSLSFTPATFEKTLLFSF